MAELLRPNIKINAPNITANPKTIAKTAGPPFIPLVYLHAPLIKIEYLMYILVYKILACNYSGYIEYIYQILKIYHSISIIGGELLQEVIEVFFISLTIILSVITLEVRSLFRASIIFAVMCVSVAILFWILGAYYVAVFQLLVYAGAMIVLLLAVVALTAGREREIK